MRDSLRIALILAVVATACAPPSDSQPRVDSQQAPTATAAVALPNASVERADALLADLRRREAEQAKAEQETSRSAGVPVITEYTPRAADSPSNSSRQAAVLEPLPEVPRPERLPDSFDILSSRYSITERNRTWWRFSWTMSVRNLERVPIAVRAEMQFKNSQGFILDTSTEVTAIDGSHIETIDGFALIRAEQAPLVATATAVVRKR